MNQWGLGRKQTACRRKRVIVIAAEGEVTEPEYFQRLNSMSTTTYIHVIENLGNGSDPCAVQARMNGYLKENRLKEVDEAWIVIDQDKWPPEKIEKVKNWTEKSKNGNYHLAVSNRRFEDWLKLHVEGDEAAKNKYHSLLCGREKHIPDNFVTKERVLNAMTRAKQLYPTSCSVGNVFEILESFFRE